MKKIFLSVLAIAGGEAELNLPAACHGDGFLLAGWGEQEASELQDW